MTLLLFQWGFGRPAIEVLLEKLPYGSNHERSDPLTVNLATLLPRFQEQIGLSLVLVGPPAQRVLQPGVKSTGMNPQNAAHRPHRELQAVQGNDADNGGRDGRERRSAKSSITDPGPATLVPILVSFVWL